MFGRKLQWSHGRLTVVTLSISELAVYEGWLQWSHGRLTVVTLKDSASAYGDGRFNGATVV